VIVNFKILQTYILYLSLTSALHQMLLVNCFYDRITFFNEALFAEPSNGVTYSRCELCILAEMWTRLLWLFLRIQCFLFRYFFRNVFSSFQADASGRLNVA